MWTDSAIHGKKVIKIEDTKKDTKSTSQYSYLLLRIVVQRGNEERSRGVHGAQLLLKLFGHLAVRTNLRRQHQHRLRACERENKK